MKLLLSLLVLVLVSINLVIGFTAPPLYANFIPYQNSECTGSMEGIGLSILVGPCIYNIGGIGGYEDRSTSFSLFVNALRVGIEQYDNADGAEGKCDGREFTNFYSFKNSTCNITPPFLIDHNGTVSNGLPIKQQYSKFSITDKPFFGLPNENSNTQIYTQYSQNSTQECSSSNYLYSMYFTSGLEITFNNSGSDSNSNSDDSNGDYSSVSYSCNQNKQPILSICKTTGQCIKESVELNCENNQSIYCI